MLITKNNASYLASHLFENVGSMCVEGFCETIVLPFILQNRLLMGIRTQKGLHAILAKLHMDLSEEYKFDSN